MIHTFKELLFDQESVPEPETSSKEVDDEISRNNLNDLMKSVLNAIDCEAVKISGTQAVLDQSLLITWGSRVGIAESQIPSYSRGILDKHGSSKMSAGLILCLYSTKAREGERYGCFYTDNIAGMQEKQLVSENEQLIHVKNWPEEGKGEILPCEEEPFRNRLSEIIEKKLADESGA